MLYREFAIEPNQIKSLHDLRLIEARFGYDKGALISEFPRKWLRNVIEALNAANDDTQIDVLTDLLRELKNKTLHRYSRNYEGDTWLSSAQISHEQKAFHRVIETSVSEPPVWVDSLYRLTNDDFEIIAPCDRTASQMSDVAETLLVGAEKVTLVDPYFSPTKLGYIKTLEAMMQKCQKGSVTFTIFCEEDQQTSWAERSSALQKLKQKIPANVSCEWAFLDDGGTGFLHQRMLFTAKGGLIYDRGFQEPSDVNQKAAPNALSLLTTNKLQKAAMDYNLAQLTRPLTLAQQVWNSR